MQGPLILSPNWSDYALLDCGDGRKLERFGSTTMIRSEPKAWWSPQHPKRWTEADVEYHDNGVWRASDRHFQREWTMSYGDLLLEARMTEMSKHVGVFPEQEPHWAWIRKAVATTPKMRVLNLFGYTGIASLVAASAGAEVVHVDASKPSIAWARENQERSGLGDAPIRWLLDDAFKFVQREIRRKRQYDMILLDPPSFGRGPRGEIWKVEKQIVELLENLRTLLVPQKGRLILTLYNLEASPLMLANLVHTVFPAGNLEFGELVLPVENSELRLPLSLFVRWNQG